MSEGVKEILDMLIEEKKNIIRSEDIICPYCKTVQDNETKYRFVTYWGEDGKRKLKCYDCNKLFWVNEIVRREFESITKEWITKMYPEYEVDD